jgi:hypothetical protein
MRSVLRLYKESELEPGDGFDLFSVSLQNSYHRYLTLGTFNRRRMHAKIMWTDPCFKPAA